MDMAGSELTGQQKWPKSNWKTCEWLIRLSQMVQMERAIAQTMKNLKYSMHKTIKYYGAPFTLACADGVGVAVIVVIIACIWKFNALK